MIRGILATLYAAPKPGSSLDAARLQDIYEQAYRDEPFVDVLPQGEFPPTRDVKGANGCRISVNYLPHNSQIVVLSAIDNLVKGASGQAVQIMNIMLGFEETTGLDNIALAP
jgi:N-acetyl-gamma-glutamyl-phosphate reductase